MNAHISIRKPQSQRVRSRRWRSYVLPPLVFIALLLLYGFWLEPDSLRVGYYRIALDPQHAVAPAALRVAVISDLHGGAPWIDAAKIDQVVVLTNAAKPDLVLLTGDYVITGVLGGRYMPIETIAEHLKALQAPFGVFAVLGNHDRREDNIPRFTTAFAQAGIRLLEDSNAIVQSEGGAVHIAGISDFNTGPVDIADALSGIPAAEHAICFTHSPDVFPELPETCGLTVAGHTHGGQVWIPGIGRPIIPSRYPGRYEAGVVREGPKTLFVATGIGTSIIPVRFGVPPEVAILEIDSAR